eukprot:SAG11_NODE_2966_length_2806_cov_2.326334_2_plen_89_part_00
MVMTESPYYAPDRHRRWMTDDNIDGTTGDVTGSRIPSVTRFCRRVVLLREVETMIYVCILTAAIVSGLQSYKVNSPFEDALWCHGALI